MVGGATIHLFNMKKQLKTGKHKLRLWAGKEADGSINTNTPGKVIMFLINWFQCFRIEFFLWFG